MGLAVLLVRLMLEAGVAFSPVPLAGLNVTFTPLPDLSFMSRTARPELGVTSTETSPSSSLRPFWVLRLEVLVTWQPEPVKEPVSSAVYSPPMRSICPMFWTVMTMASAVWL